MLEGLKNRSELLAVAKQKARDFDAKTIHLADLDEAKKDGWLEQRVSKRTARIVRPKSRPALLEDRVWTLLYRLGFDHLADRGGVKITGNDKDPDASVNQLDCVAVDPEVALMIECKSFQDPKKDPRFQEKLSKFVQLRKPFADSIRQLMPGKRQAGAVMFTWDLLIGDADAKRAEEAGVIMFTEPDLAYFEALVDHLGVAARYQFLADVFPGKQIPGLEIRVPALRSKMGRITCYSFAVKPEYLLKIAFVSHRARGHATDVDAYQRMVQKSRLKKIREYISDDGVFPTNIVLNIENSKYTRFEHGAQDGNDQSARFGWLTLSPAYKSAWVIDGQHRLFAYSGHERASTSYLQVMAFDGLSGSMQAKLFVDINHEQKSVKRSLLDELWAVLHWEAEDRSKRIRAVISKAVQGINADPQSPLFGRVLMSDASKSEKACISLSSLIGALDRLGLYLIPSRKDATEHGPLWCDDNVAMMKRTMEILNCWFNPIAAKASEWWQLGSGEGGGLAMNDGVTACINVMRSVFDHLGQRVSLCGLENYELAGKLQPYANALGEYFAGMTVTEREEFRSLRGVQGQTSARRMCETAIHNVFPDFNPPGLAEYMERAKSDTNDRASKVIHSIERLLQDTIVSTLKEEHGTTEDAWWFEGVPKAVRLKVDQQINESDGKAGSREQNFNLIQYREIITHNWELFEKLFGYGTGSKDKRTAWLNEVNLMRNSVMHPSRREYLGPEKLARLEEYDRWLRQTIAAVPAESTNTARASA